MPLFTVPTPPLEVWMRVIDGRIINEQIAEKMTTQRGLAEATGLSRGHIGDLCSGRRVQCTPETAHKIAKALGVTVGSLFLVESSIQETHGAKFKLAPRKRKVSPPVVASRRGRSRRRVA